MRKTMMMAVFMMGLAAPVAAQELALNASALDPKIALRDSQAAIGRDMSRHQLLDARGKPIRLGDFAGKPLLVSFIYTGCFQVCPTTTQSLAEAVDQLGEVFGADKFNVVSIGFNQPFDSPTAIRAFAAQMGIDKPNWKFLSPPPTTVDALTADFGFRFAATPAGFDHMLTVSVLDGRGRIATQVYGDRLTRDQLGEPLRRMLRDAPMPADMPLADLIERVRILCTVYDPETGTYRYDYGLFLEIAGGVTFALAMVWFFLAEWRNRRRLKRRNLRAAPAQQQPQQQPQPQSGTTG